MGTAESPYWGHDILQVLYVVLAPVCPCLVWCLLTQGGKACQMLELPECFGKLLARPKDHRGCWCYSCVQAAWVLPRALPHPVPTPGLDPASPGWLTALGHIACRGQHACQATLSRCLPVLRLRLPSREASDCPRKEGHCRPCPSEQACLEWLLLSSSSCVSFGSRLRVLDLCPLFLLLVFFGVSEGDSRVVFRMPFGAQGPILDLMCLACTCSASALS